MAPLKISSLVLILLLSACTKDVGRIDDGSLYPAPVSKIMSTRCAITGCHNTISREAAAGLSLKTWESAFEGSRNGAVIIPFRPDFSTLCFYTNSFPEMGPVLSPSMPIGSGPLSKEDYQVLSAWIKEGSPNSNGEIKFQNHTNKLYVINRLCDMVSVIDGQSKLQMRCIDVGTIARLEFPVCIKISPDRRYWYVSFLASSLLQKFDATSDAYAGAVDLGGGVWSDFEISADSKHAYCVDNSNIGKIASVDLEQMKVKAYFTSPHFVYPKGVALNEKARKLYVGAENGNYISVIDLADSISHSVKQVVLDGTFTANNSPSLDPQCLLLNASLKKCFVACYNSNEIRIIDTESDTVVKSILLGVSPNSMAYAEDKKVLFVGSMNDSISFADNLGSVKVIDPETEQVIKTLRSGYQPTGISVNNVFGYAAVINSNINPKGPQPHHTTGCSGRNGYISYINLNTLELTPRKYELSVYPSAIALRK